MINVGCAAPGCPSDVQGVGPAAFPSPYWLPFLECGAGDPGVWGQLGQWRGPCFLGPFCHCCANQQETALRLSQQDKWVSALIYAPIPPPPCLIHRSDSREYRLQVWCLVSGVGATLFEEEATESGRPSRDPPFKIWDVGLASDSRKYGSMQVEFPTMA